MINIPSAWKDWNIEKTQTHIFLVHLISSVVQQLYAQFRRKRHKIVKKFWDIEIYCSINWLLISKFLPESLIDSIAFFFTSPVVILNLCGAERSKTEEHDIFHTPCEKFAGWSILPRPRWARGSKKMGEGVWEMQSDRITLPMPVGYSMALAVAAHLTLFIRFSR